MPSRIYHIIILQELRRKTARLVAAKAVLAARVDASHESPDGKIGGDFLADIEGKLEKLQEPPPVKAVKVSCRCVIQLQFHL